MHQEKNSSGQPPPKLFRRIGTKLYFSKATERKFFFILTLMMLLGGVLAKIGLF